MTDHVDEPRAVGRAKIEKIIEELRRQEAARQDFVVDSSDLSIGVGEKGEPRLIPSPSAMDFLPREGAPIKEQALVQIAGRAVPDGIPIKFFRRAWAHNQTRLAEYLSALMKDHPKRRLCRLLDGWLRAYLGQTYRAIDNLDIAKEVLQIALNNDVVPIEASVSDTHLRMRLASRNIGESLLRGQAGNVHAFFTPGQLSRDGDPRGWLEDDGAGEDGDTIHPVASVRNSETGHGGCDFDGGILLRACFNMAWVTRDVHQVHIGEKLEEGVFSKETYEKHAILVYSQIRDAGNAFFNPERFRDLIARIEGTKEHVVRAPSVAANVLISECSELRDSDIDNLLSYFVEQPGERSEFNLGQAVSRLAQDVDPDRAEGIEWFSGKVCTGEFTDAINRATERHERELAKVR